MSPRTGQDSGTGLALAVLRLTLVAVMLISEQLVQARQLGDLQFYLVLSLAAGYALLGIAVVLRTPGGSAANALARLHPPCDVFFLAALAYTSGGAFSDVRKAFFVIPLAAAFSERPRSTAIWSMVAVAAFASQAVLAGGHPAGAVNTWERMTLDQSLYLAWTGAAGTMLAIALRRRSTQADELSQSRQRLVTQAIESVERERTRLAGVLHDWPVQNLIAARHDLRRAQARAEPETFERVHEALETTIAQLREEIFNLHPHVLDHVGLTAALEQVARRHTREGKLAVTVAAAAEAEIDVAYRQVLFALGRELLGNAAKHAGASEIRLSLTHEPDRLMLLVTDNGCGIPDGRIRRALLDGHIGLAAVHERVAALGGALSIDTKLGSGTSVRVTLPPRMREDQPDQAVVSLEVSDRVTRQPALRVSTA